MIIKDPNSLWRHHYLSHAKNKLLYFEWSPPWHVGWWLSGGGCQGELEVFETNSRSQHWQTMTRVLYISCISETILEFWTWHDTSLPKKSCKHTYSFSTKALHTTLNLQWWKLPLKHHTCYVLHYFKFSPLLADILADIFLNILSDILSPTFSLNFFQTYLLTFLTYFWPFFLTSFLRRSFWTSFRHIFWHSFWLILWHLATTSLRHSFCNYYQSFRSRLRSGTPHWTRRIAVEVRHATLNSRVRHATLNSRARGWGPARHTELTRSRLRSGTSHGRNRQTTRCRGRRRTRRKRRPGGEGGEGGGGGEETDIKSNNPHLTGGEQIYIYIIILLSMKYWLFNDGILTMVYHNPHISG